MRDDITNQAAPTILIFEEEAMIAEDMVLTLKRGGYEIAET
ncbi:MAG: hypothetical protein V2B18_20155 [Pseudomonadota bacterium]